MRLFSVIFKHCAILINILDTVMTTLQDSKESESFIIKDQGQRPPKQRLKWALMAIGVLVIIGAIIGIFHHFFTMEACPINESCQTNFQILKKLNITLDENEKENCSRYGIAMKLPQ